MDMEVVITAEGMKMVPKKKPDTQAAPAETKTPVPRKDMQAAPKETKSPAPRKDTQAALKERKRPEETVPSLEDILAGLDAEEDTESDADFLKSLGLNPDPDDEVDDMPSAASILAALDEEELAGSAASTGEPSTADHVGSVAETEVLDNASDEPPEGALPVVTREAYLAKLASEGKSEELIHQPKVKETALAVIPPVETFLQRLERDAKIAAQEEAEERDRECSAGVRDRLSQAVVQSSPLAQTTAREQIAPRKNADAAARGRATSGSLSGLFREKQDSGPLPGLTGTGSAAFGESRSINLRGRGRGKGLRGYTSKAGEFIKK